MKYTGNICKGCNLPFEDGDDVVVCPECGTPQHRECYAKENKCVCAHLHGEDYAWQGKVNNESPLPVQKTETVSCPNCGYENPVGTPVCKQCGMKFTLFGMNVVDAMHQQEKKSANVNRDIPDYSAPFTLGEGEAFEKKTEKEGAAAPDEVQQKLVDILSGNSTNENAQAERLNMGGPFPATDEIEGVLTNNVGNFIGSNAMNYIAKFKKAERGSKISFNFAAFFFGPYWFFYRKLYKAGIVVMTALLAASIVASPYVYKMLEAYEQLLPMLQTETMTEAQLNEFFTAFTSASYPMMIYFAVSLGLQLICGFAANSLYKKYVIGHVRVLEGFGKKQLAMRYIIRNGGASILIALAAYFANQLLTMIVSSML